MEHCQSLTRDSAAARECEGARSEHVSQGELCWDQRSPRPAGLGSPRWEGLQNLSLPARLPGLPFSSQVSALLLLSCEKAV